MPGHYGRNAAVSCVRGPRRPFPLYGAFDRWRIRTTCRRHTAADDAGPLENGQDSFRGRLISPGAELRRFYQVENYIVLRTSF